MSGELPYESGPAGLVLRIRVTPGAGRSEVAGLHHDAEGRPALQVRVTARPEKGRATAAALETLARALGMPPSRLALKCGGRNRTKLIAVAGDARAAQQAVMRLMSQERKDA